VACIATKKDALRPLGVIHDPGSPCHTTVHVRFAPESDHQASSERFIRERFLSIEKFLGLGVAMLT
jgi:hypothetical protein